MRYIFSLIGLAVLSTSINIVFSKDALDEPVSKHGQLSVVGTDLVDEHGELVQLKGMSLAWTVWWPQYWNQESVDGIKNGCHSNVVRAAMGVDTQDGGYLTDPEKHLGLLETVVQAAIKDDLYVIVDWHEEQGQDHLNESLAFFDYISKKYGSYPNIIYETMNEPTNQSWSEVLKPYHEAVINTIRANDPDNLIILGTPTWSQNVDQAAEDPITDQINIMYTLHYYAGTHKQWLRDTAQSALDKGLPIFVTEYGVVSIMDVIEVDEEEAQKWWEFCEKNKLSYVNWSICDVDNAGAALLPGTPTDKVCQEEYLTEGARLVVEQNMK